MTNYFFRSPHPLWYLLCDGGLLYLTLLTFFPNRLPYQYLGWFGTWTNYLAYHQHYLLLLIFISALIAHVYESIIARQICLRLNLNSFCTSLWIIQTLLLGYPSLGILKKHAEKNRKSF